MGSGLPLFPEEASTIAGQVDALFFFLVALTIFFTLLVAALIGFFGIRYRRRAENEVPTQVTGSTLLEVGGMVPLLGLAMIAFVWGARIYITMVSPPADALDVSVVAKQWMWKYQHADGQQEINDLHVPLGRPIKLTMTSQDVIHSYYVPAFRVKADVLPGRYTTLWFEATKSGTYHLFCTEYCGTNHSRMIGSVIVMEQSQYQEWLSGGSGGPSASPVATGEQIFQQFGCAGCHRADGNGPGPSLQGIFGQQVQLQDGRTAIADETYLRESVVNPNAKIAAGFQAIMPTFEGQVSEEQLFQLIAYIKSIGPAQPDGAPPENPSDAENPSP